MLQKKVMLVVLLVLTALSVQAQQLPYSKMLSLSNDELKERKFKYDSNKNRYTLSKSNGMNNTLNILSAVGGTTADIRPHEDDYTIMVQKGANDQSAFVNVVFHNDDTYHTILNWIAENDIIPVETNSGKMNVIKFTYLDQYQVVLVLEKVAITATTGKTSALVKSFDESYNVYNYSIFTRVKPDSKWHRKEAEKKAKNQLKGKKEDINDLM